MGLVVKTDWKPVTVYRQDKTANSGATYQQYSLGVSSKDKDGNWVNGFLDCQFKKGIDIPNKSKINIKNAFYTVSEYNGKKYYKIFVMEYEMEEAGKSPVQVDEAGFMNLDGIDIEELPFE